MCTAHVMDSPLNDALFNLLCSLTTLIMKNWHTTFNFHVNIAAHGGYAFNNHVLFWCKLFQRNCLTNTCIKDSKEMNAHNVILYVHFLPCSLHRIGVRVRQAETAARGIT